MPCSTPACASRMPNGACATSPISRNSPQRWASPWSKPYQCPPTILSSHSSADSETLRDVIHPADLVPQEGVAERDESFGVTHQHVGDQDAAVRAAFGGNSIGARHAAFHEVGGNGCEIIMRQPFSGVTPGIVPARTELAAAADIGLHRGAATLQPE